MNSILMKRLIERNVIRQGTEVDAMYYGHSLSSQDNAYVEGTFSILSAKVFNEGSKVVFSVRGHDLVVRQIPAEQILSLDGMTADRLAPIYAMNEAGEDIKISKRRGRKPRIQSIQSGDNERETMDESS